MGARKVGNLAEALLRQEIERRGPMDFSRFVELALYHPRYGYYNQTASPRGRNGDYFTSLQVSDLFPRLMARAIAHMRDTLGTDQFSLIEVGSGDGEFLEAVLMRLKEIDADRSTRAGGLKVWAVERSRSARDRLIKRLSRFPKCTVVESLDDIDWMGTLEGCIFSNELFDALPFYRLRKRGDQWKNVAIDIKDDTLVEIETHSKIVNRQSKIEVEEGHEIEWRPQINDVYREWGQLLSRGYVLTVDYGHPRASFYSPARSQGTWLCFHQHKAVKTWAENIGKQDITAHVDFTQLVEAGQLAGFDPRLYCSQGLFLSHVGQTDLEQFLAQATDADRRARTAAVQQLIHPDAMGERFWVLLQAKEADTPAPFAAIPNRLPRLL